VSGLKVPGILLEAQATNLVIQGDVPSTANGWTATGTTPLSPTVYAGRQFAFINNGPGGALFRAVTFTGNGTKYYSFLVKQDGAVTGGVATLIYDNTAGVSRGNVSASIDASGVVTTSVSNGATVLRVEPLADGVYRVHAQVTGVIAANANRVYLCNNSTATSYLVSGVVAQDQYSPALIPTTTGTVTTGAETFTLPFRATPGPSTWYVRFVESGTLYTGLSSALLGIGASAVPSLFFLNDTSGHYAFEHREATDVYSSAAAAPTLGQLCEVRGVLGATGTSIIGQSINGGVEAVSSASAALAIASAWFDTTLTVNDRGGAPGFTSIQAIRIAAGVQSLAYMRTG
jgi:hypothetical protein